MAGLAGKLGAFYQDYGLTTKHKLIADFQDDETWTKGTPGTQADDSTYYRLGIESIRLTEDDGSGGLIYTDQNSVSLNLAQFQSGAASATSDYIYLVCYISDVTKVSSLTVGFSDEATYDGDPSYVYTVSSGFSNGWNTIKILKSAFTNTNMSNWSSIQSMRVGWTSTASATAAYVSFQALYLIEASHDLILSNYTAYIVEQITLVSNWTLDLGEDLHETSSLGNEWKDRIPGLAGFSVSVERFWQNETNSDDLGTTQAVGLYTNTTNNYRYEGSGIVNSVSITNPVDGVVGESIGFDGTGTLYYTAVVTKDS